MAPLANADGSTLSQFAIAAVICGLLAIVAANPTARAGASDFLSGMRSSRIGRFFYGTPPKQAQVKLATPSEEPEAAPPKADVVDTFDYSIFARGDQAPDLDD